MNGSHARDGVVLSSKANRFYWGLGAAIIREKTMSKRIFTGCRFINNHIGISVGENLDLEVNDTLFQNNHIAVQIIEDLPQEILDLFKSGVSRSKLKEVLLESLKTDDQEPEALARRLKKSGLSTWIANSANTLTVATAIIEIVKLLASR